MVGEKWPRLRQWRVLVTRQSVGLTPSRRRERPWRGVARRNRRCQNHRSAKIVAHLLIIALVVCNNPSLAATAVVILGIAIETSAAPAEQMLSLGSG